VKPIFSDVLMLAGVGLVLWGCFAFWGWPAVAIAGGMLLAVGGSKGGRV
jgi:hypothetical protein